MTEINQNSHFYIRASAEVPLLSGIQCVTSVTFSQPSPVAGLSWGTLKTEAANFPEEALLFTFYNTGSQPSFRYHAKWKNYLSRISSPETHILLLHHRNHKLAETFVFLYKFQTFVGIIILWLQSKLKVIT